MQKLPGGDSVFLSVERSSAHLHTGALVVVDPSGAKGFSHKKLLHTLEERIHRVPKLTWRLRQVPFGLDRPYWEEGVPCRVEEHVHRISLPSPGGEKELAKLVGELTSRQLDRNRPLWEIWYIEGLKDKRVGVLMKMHHCLFDGVSGAGLGEILADLEPNPPADATLPDVPELDSGRQYSDLELYARGCYSLLGMPYNLGKSLSSAGWQSLAKSSRKRKVKHLINKTKTPRSKFNAPLGSSRGVVFATAPLATVKKIKKHFGVTINDVVLALCSSTIRRYLQAQGDLPKDSLVGGVPVSTRSGDDKSLDNQVGTMSVALETQLDDPLKRLMAIHKNTKNAKEVAAALGATDIQSVANSIPPVAIELLGWVFDTAKLDAVLPVVVNTVISNVPGPPIPLYLCGGKIEALYPLAPILMGMGLNITVMSYVEDINFGFMLDPHLIPDPWFLAEGIALAVDELEAVMVDEQTAVSAKTKTNSKISTKKRAKAATPSI